MRTTIDIDAPILKDLKRLQKEEGKTLGQLVSELLATALTQHKKPARAKRRFTFVTQRMKPRVDLEDRDAVWKLLSDEEHSR